MCRAFYSSSKSVGFSLHASPPPTTFYLLKSSSTAPTKRSNYILICSAERNMLQCALTFVTADITSTTRLMSFRPVKTCSKFENFASKKRFSAGRRSQLKLSQIYSHRISSQLLKQNLRRQTHRSVRPFQHLVRLLGSRDQLNATSKYLFNNDIIPFQIHNRVRYIRKQ